MDALLLLTLTVLTAISAPPARCQAAPLPPLRMGFQAQLGYDPRVKFGPLMAEIGDRIGRTISISTYDDNVQLAQATVAQQLDFAYTGPVMFACLQLVTPGVKAMNELISLSVLDNETAVEPLAGAIVARKGSGIRTAHDLAGRVVLAGNIANLASFQAQWQAVEGPAFSLFRDSRGVFFSANPLGLVIDLAAGLGDVAFVEGSVLPALQRTLPSMQEFEVVLPVPPTPDYPYSRSTALYAYSLISAQNPLNFSVRADLSRALLNIQPDDPVASPAEGDFSSWSTSGDYGTVRSVLTKQQFIDPRTSMCKLGGTASDFVSCPAGYRIEGNPDTACARNKVPCPFNYTCICSPCARILPPATIAGLPVYAFALIFPAAALLCATVVFFAIRLVVLHVRTVPAAEVRLDLSRPLGEGSLGPLVAGQFRGQAVALKRVFPHRGGVASMLETGPTSGLTPDPICPSTARARLSLLRAWEGIAACMWLPAQYRRRLGEVQAASRLQHPNLLQIYGVCCGPYHEDMLMMTPLFHTGTVGDLITNATVELTPQLVTDIALGVASAMAYLHAQPRPVLGKNLKPHHILLDAAWRPFLGVSFRPPNRNSIWAAPEVLRGGPWTAKADVFSFSMLLYMLLTRRPPATEGADVERTAAMLHPSNSLVDESRPPLTGTGPLHEITFLCWSEDPAMRPAFPEIVKMLDPPAPPDVRPSSMSRPSLHSEPPSSTDSADFQLLNRVFPEHVIDKLRAKLPVEPESFDEVTIFFSDIVGFTAMTSLMHPQSVLSMLHRLYHEMDTLAEQHGVYKVETIGDW